MIHQVRTADHSGAEREMATFSIFISIFSENGSSAMPRHACYYYVPLSSSVSLFCGGNRILASTSALSVRPSNGLKGFATFCNAGNDGRMPYTVEHNCIDVSMY